MQRIIEIALFLAPFAAFVIWRRVIGTLRLPAWFVGGAAAVVLALLATLLWSRHRTAGDADRAYIPAIMQNGRIIPDSQGPKR